MMIIISLKLSLFHTTHIHNIIMRSMLLLLTTIALVSPTQSFIHSINTVRATGTQLHAQEGTTLLQVTHLDGSEETIQKAAAFMVDAFWLQSPQAISEGLSDNNIPNNVKSSLINVQANDLMKKYGERLGRRKLDAVMLAATDGDTADNFLGLVTVEVRLLDTISKSIINAEKSELMLTNSISQLGPKQRREYKDASVIDIANALLPPEISAVCSLSNLCVSPNARRSGIAAKLCNEAESLAKELGFDEMYLCVESENKAAASLYLEKLGYGVQFESSSKSLRVNGGAGVFYEVDSDILIMNKKI